MLILNRSQANELPSATRAITEAGWYELTDGRVARYTWAGGRLRATEVVATWAETTSEAERIASETAEDDRRWKKQTRSEPTG